MSRVVTELAFQELLMPRSRTALLVARLTFLANGGTAGTSEEGQLCIQMNPPGRTSTVCGQELPSELEVPAFRTEQPRCDCH